MNSKVDRKAIWSEIRLSYLALAFGFGVYRSIFDKFAVDVCNMPADMRGLLEAVREVPGLLGFLGGVFALYLSDRKQGAVMLIVMGAGLTLLGFADAVPAAFVGTFIMSVGFHYFTASNASYIIKGFPDDVPFRLARLRGYDSATRIAVTLFLVGLTILLTGGRGSPGLYHSFFLTAGVAVLIAGFIRLHSSRAEKPDPRPKDGLKPRRELWLFYLLNFLDGSRRHIFMTFAIYLLAREFNVRLGDLLWLFLFNQALVWVMSRYIGSILERFGEQKVLMFNYLVLVPIFLVYAYSQNIWILFIVFSIDNVLFTLSVARQSFLKKIARPEHVTAAVSQGLTVNHIAAIILPITGGVIWERFAYSWTFVFGAIIALVTLFVSSMINREIALAEKRNGPQAA